jgi:hypothetical protein
VNVIWNFRVGQILNPSGGRFMLSQHNPNPLSRRYRSRSN